MNIAIDLDGTIAEYKGFKGSHVIGNPFPYTKEWLKALVNQGHNLSLFTARAVDNENIEILEDWLIKHELKEYFDYITNKKEYFFDLFIDDRAIRFEGVFPEISIVNNTKPWWKN